MKERCRRESILKEEEISDWKELNEEGAGGGGGGWRKYGKRGTTEGNKGFRDGWMEEGGASGLIVQSVGDLRKGG